jgi:ribosomal protein S27E
VSDEEEYFKKRDMEAKAKLKAKLEAQKAEAEKAARKELHFMKCGKCGSEMMTQVFRGIEIERCGGCGAVLLDPGELEELAGEDQSDVISNFFSVFGGRGR